MLRRGSTLIEVVVIVATLAIAVPPALVTLREMAGQRADSVSVARATALASAVLEQIIADSASDEPGLGFGAFADPAAYMTTGTTGLRDRLAWVADPFESVGLSYEVEFSGLVGPSGSATGNPSQDVFRRVTVTVTYPSVDGDRTMTLGAIVGDLS